ncbi:hypothetical protein [Exiguobacterium sp. s192]|uniref:hypothetical protein n=1 Tax=Exiguobacterium sp. s192 TaxID=2751206 RepID=UPI001BE62751|nr:hypothetical protein [Exiguobacterium sp. s192]
MKKCIVGFVLLFFFFSSPVSASVSLPNVSQINESIYDSYVIRGNTLYYSDYDGTKLYDLNTGTLLRIDDTYDQLLDVSTDQAWTVQKDTDDSTISIHDKFGEAVTELYRVNYNGMSFEFGYSIQAKFLPNTSTLVIATNDNLIFYDVKTDSVSFMRGINTNGILKVSSEYITIGNSSSIRVIDHQGQTITEILPSEQIISYDLTLSNELIYNTVGSRVYRYKENFEQAIISPLRTYQKIDLDESGLFLGTEDGSLYDTETSKRIFSNMARGTIAFNENSSKILILGDSVRIYDTKNLNKRTVNMKINSKLSSVTERNELTPSIIVTSKNGSISTVTSPITWRTDNSQVVYFSKGKLIAKSPGKATIKATFEDFTATLSITVKKDPRPSNTQWLTSQKNTLNLRGSFLNAPYKIYDVYSKVKGSNGKIYYYNELYTNGVFKEKWLYGTYRQKKTVDEILLSLSMEKRTDVTEKQIVSVFGKPKKVFKYEDGMPSKLTQGSKTLEQHKIKRISLYILKKSHALEVIYDDKGYVRYMHLYESQPDY